ncbi:protein RIC-3 isoform X2 [Sphaerodactylus townsendi]|uniref:Protein RIC-3 n=2 Tax=Sphaerodactylus townsendi TaxID=933632 RepID=A0ACB8G373_9SAUR|nr:protein RIC-3 isoform X2 [Sphaerodactylus townsendi]XP_048339566.1 protein RIC-3 isoform X2 [Sphaerodactylus townsendi]XP_048339567.1 protein RIC-3 isoform X2 [Sphaerodactylus townsendi]
MQHPMSPETRPPATHFPRSHLVEAVAKAKGGGGGGGGGGSGRGLVGQVIPIYGFGILLYILYILFKLSSKGKTMTEEQKWPPSAPGNMNRKITDYELAQLQDKLRETEEAMEKLINKVGPNCESRAQNVTTDQEKRLLQQLREITKVMKEGKLIDGISPEKEAEEAPYMQDWEGYPEETYPAYDNSDCFKHRQDTVLVEYPHPSQPSAEEIAERMEFVDDDECACSETLLSALVTVNNDLVSRQEKEQATSTDHSRASQNFEKCQCCHYEDDHPVVIAENEGFYLESCSETENLAKEELLVDSDLENSASKDQHYTNPDKIGMLRKRNTRGTELLGK